MHKSYITIILSIVIPFVSMHTVKPSDYQVTPIIFTPEGIINFFQKIYNQPDYKEVLVNDFSHMLQFLQYGKQTNQNRTFLCSVIRLFTNAVKRSYYVNPQAFLCVLEKLPILLANTCDQSSLTDEQAQAATYEILYTTFESEFDDFKNDPVLFLQRLSKQLIQKVYQPNIVVNDASIDDLRSILLIFLEVGLGRLVWNPAQQEETWKSAVIIADQLDILLHHHLIKDQDTLNDLYITLVHRYCLFVELMGADLPMTFYEKMKSLLAQRPCRLLDLAEQEECIQSKAAYLSYALLSGQARALAKDQTILQAHHGQAGTENR